MGTTAIYSMTTEELEKVLNQSKNAYLQYLSDNGYIDAEKTNYLAMNTGVLLRKPDFFSSLWNKYFKTGKDASAHFIVVEQKSLSKDRAEKQAP